MTLADKLQSIAKQRAIKARVGIIERKNYPDGQTVAQVGYDNEYGVPHQKIPSRPFFRTAIAKNRSELSKKLGQYMAAGYSPQDAMRYVCEHMVNELKVSVITWKQPPNKPYTIQQKGFNAPLRGTDRLLRNSFSYEIKE